MPFAPSSILYQLIPTPRMMGCVKDAILGSATVGRMQSCITASTHVVVRGNKIPQHSTLLGLLVYQFNIVL